MIRSCAALAAAAFAILAGLAWWWALVIGAVVALILTYALRGRLYGAQRGPGSPFDL